MRYVFYDFETGGLSDAFDSIIQAAAILTDQDFNIIDSFDMRGRMKKEYPVPHPKALLINGTSVDLLKNHENSNFALISKMQQKFSVTELELLSIVETLKEFKGMMWAQCMKIFTDHKTLMQNALGMIPDRIYHWRLLLEEFGPEIEYIKDIDNTVANAISRLEYDPDT